MWLRVKFGTKKFLLLYILIAGVIYCLCDLYVSYNRISNRPNHGKRNSRISIFKSGNESILKQKIFSLQDKMEENVNIKSNAVLRYGDGTDSLQLAVVVCGKRLNQTMVSLKSAVALSKSALHLIIISDDANRNSLKERLLDWPDSILKRISFEIHPITFPEGTENEWKKLFKLCACQRLFLPTILQHIDALLYIDTDVIFLRPVEDIWAYFSKMNSSQIAGLSPEHEDFATGWYNRFARHPYYEPLGVNSGVMLMNLTRMRKFHWQDYLQPIYQEYKLKIAWGDQDIINIIFHYHSDKLLIFPCDWNYRPDHCMYTSVCKSAEENGVAIVHGNRGVFVNNKQPAFRAIYSAMESYELGTNLIEYFLKPLQEKLHKTLTTNCGKLHFIFTKAIEKLSKEPIRLYR
ncbi:glucoside xylosyltransferase 1-like [Centruroides sculpturatus]|uniref:glucoside xylosyltransferase 1-like n=1 Tax=Centruroides sculpturatus TaxID=218467 RepID=UPI000C6E7723|nr:glucoside xylosyltransferase 1-like [Centruroides sculpturatus]